MIFCDGVSFRYPGMGELFRGLNLSMEPGTRMVLGGPSGSGKTTLLYLLAGLLQPEKGAVRTMRASMVFQEDRLLPGLTALEQMRLVAPQRKPEELGRLLEELGLSGWEDAKPGKMSGGMRRRVALARAAAFNAPLWLLDEPFTGLDAENLARAAAFILRRVPADGYVIAALHKPEEAALLEASVTPLAALCGRAV